MRAIPDLRCGTGFRDVSQETMGNVPVSDEITGAMPCHLLNSFSRRAQRA
jgi:hypothetical protein